MTCPNTLPPEAAAGQRGWPGAQGPWQPRPPDALSSVRAAGPHPFPGALGLCLKGSLLCGLWCRTSLRVTPLAHTQQTL